MAESNLPAKAAENTLAKLLKQYEPQIKALVPQHLSAERMLSFYRTVVTSTPALQECSPMSVIAGLVKASRLGLNIDPEANHCYLIPRWNKNTKRQEATFQLGARGRVELCMRSGEYKSIRPELVYENDKFEMGYEGTELLFRHVVQTKGPRGAVIGAYLRSVLKDGSLEIEWMPREEIEEVRRRYSDEGSIPWKNNWGEMAKKTVAIRGTKWHRKSEELADAERTERRIEEGESPEMVILDIPPQIEAAAEVAGATAASREELKGKLQQREEKRAKEEALPKREEKAPAPAAEPSDAAEPTEEEYRAVQRKALEEERRKEEEAATSAAAAAKAPAPTAKKGGWV